MAFISMPKKDNLSMKDKMAGPKVSFIQRPSIVYFCPYLGNTQLLCNLLSVNWDSACLGFLWCILELSLSLSLSNLTTLAWPWESGPVGA